MMACCAKTLTFPFYCISSISTTRPTPEPPPPLLLLSAHVCVSLDFAKPQFHWTGSRSKTEVITKERSSWRIFLDGFAFFPQCREIGSDSSGAVQCVLDEPSAKNSG